MSLSFDLSTKEGLQKLDAHLEEHSFVGGHASPTQADNEVLQALGDTPVDEYPSITRWKRNITSYQIGERTGFPPAEQKVEVKAAPKKEEEEDDDDVDLFGEDTEEDKKILEEKKKKDQGKKKKKEAAKSSILFDIKPVGDETPIAEMEKAVRAISMPGLEWQAAKYMDIAFGLQKLQILCCVEDDKVSVDDIEEKIMALEDLVQSVDIVSFNKV